MDLYAGVVITSQADALDRLFTYKVPKEFEEKLKIGHRVKVPFGMGNRMVQGYVLEIGFKEEVKFKCKYIKEILDLKPIITEEEISIIEFMRKNYLSNYYEGIKTILPNGIEKGIGIKTLNLLSIGKELSDKFLKEPYITIFNTVKNKEGFYSKNTLKNVINISVSPINTMLKHEFLVISNTKVDRADFRSFNEYKEKSLNIYQNFAVNTILNGDKVVNLLHGVTGSGKTEVYMHLVKEMLLRGKDTIILVPEISLTPQMVERFKGRFGRDICIFHSKLSDGEKFDEWLRVKEGRTKVAIGARSAVFLPFKNLGLIIVDEEHEGAYKSDVDPKYNAKEIASLRCEINDAKLVLGSATPSIESYKKAKDNEYNLIELNYRADSAEMPKFIVVDMREELKNGNKSIFSNELYNKILNRLRNKEQIILFLNRRGFSTFVSCRSCGFVFKCPKCDVSLTYHQNSGKLTCHYCGFIEDVKTQCPKCSSKYVKYFGVGTEKIEEETKRVFSGAKVLRMDLDTTRGKNSYEKIYNDFKNGNGDILIGTQMIAKGFDFKNVTLVGIIAADISLNMPDFRSAEKTFSLITQVGGRAGRAQKSGEVIIQTYNPDSFAIKCAESGDYKEFYNKEIMIRKIMEYPPFSNIALVNLSSKYENLLIKKSNELGEILRNRFQNYDNITVLGANPCPINKINENYRWQIIVKGFLKTNELREIKKIIYDNVKEVYNEIRCSIDINPNSLL